jgi:hypothetical protein
MAKQVAVKPLALAQRIGRQLAFRDVFGDAGDSRDSPAFLVDREGAVADPPNGAVRTDDAIFFVIVTRDLCPRGFEDAGAVVGMYRGSLVLGARVKRSCVPSEDFLISRTDVEDGIF